MSTYYDWLKEGTISIPTLLLKNYKQLGVTSDEFVLIIYFLGHLDDLQNVSEFKKIANHLGWTVNQVTNGIENLINNNILAIELTNDKQGKKTDHYSLRPLFERLDQENFKSNERIDETPLSSSQIVTIFEKEFGRVLSPIELDMVNQWLHKDNYDPELIQLALKQAVIHQAMSFNYIDKILLNWQKQNIKTVYEAKKNIEQFNQRYENKQQRFSSTVGYEDITIPIYQWDE